MAIAKGAAAARCNKYKNDRAGNPRPADTPNPTGGSFEGASNIGHGTLRFKL